MPPGSNVNQTSPTKRVKSQQQRHGMQKQASGLPPAGPPGGLWTSPVRHRHTPGRYTSNVLRDMYEDHLSTPSRNDRELRDALKKLRRLILENGLPEGADVSCRKSSSPSLSHEGWVSGRELAVTLSLIMARLPMQL